MDISPLPPASGVDVPSRDSPPIALQIKQAGASGVAEPNALVDVLRQAVAAGTRSTDSILRAATDAARVLTGAHGTALALRNNGVIVCRARSGKIAPELGAPLNLDSGISGECLRAATILVCNDAAADPRVDPEVCITLGVRSIVVVPLRGAVGVVGILEAFSTRADAFGREQIDSLRALAEVAEKAYGRESRPERQRPAPAPVTPPASQPSPFDPSASAEEPRVSKFSDEYAPDRRFWIPGVVAIALLMVAMVVWLSWRDPVSEIAASQPARTVSTPEEHSLPAPRASPLKPDPGIAGRQSARSKATDVLQNAAQIEPATGGPHQADPAPSPTTELSLPNQSEKDPALSRTAPESASEPPPLVSVEASSAAPEALAHLGSAPALRPQLGAAISQGVIEASLIRRVDPTYPQTARIERLAGSVILDATIGEDGSIHEVKVISGPPLLADAATEAVKKWRYRPSLLDGRPVAVQERITIVFKLP